MRGRELNSGPHPEEPERSEGVSKDGSKRPLPWFEARSFAGAYGAARNDDEIRSLVALVERLPKTTPEQYKRMEQAVASGAAGR